MSLQGERNDGATRRRARRAWTAVAAGCGLAAAAAVAIPAYSWAIQQSSTTTWSAVHPIAAVDVTAGAGALDVVPGIDGRVSLTANLSWDKDEPVVTEAWHGDVLDIAVSCPGSGSGLLSGHDCGTSLAPTVPVATAVSASSSSGDLAASRLAGALNLRTETGGITLDSTAGPVDAGTVTGGIDGSGLLGTAVTASARSGSVVLGFAEAPASVAASSVTGDVTVLLPQGGRYRVEGRSETGELLVDPALSEAGAADAVSANSVTGDVLVQYQANQAG